MLKALNLIFRFLLLFLSVFAIYHIVPFNIAEIQANSANETSAREAAFARVLHWNPRQKDALISLAELAKDQGEFEQAKKYALQALSVDPTNGHAMSILVYVYAQFQDAANVQKAVALAPQQWTAHSYVHSTLADYWAGQGDIEKVLSEWDLLLTRHKGLHTPIFPVLLSYANVEDSRYLLTPFASRPAPWWKDFFTFMINNKVDLTVLQYFYQQRVNSDTPLADTEREAYVRRLQQAKLWKLAYSSWISGLSGTQFSLIGSVYDGGFESDSHDTGFDWHFRQSKQAKITLGRTRGIKGKRALHIVFNKRKNIPFKHVWQRLLLEPERSYKVIMHSRVDSLKNPQGLIWRVACDDETTQLLGASEVLKGNKKWHELSFEFTVPEQDCTSQILRLEAASQYHHEQFFNGGIWFDQLDILPLIKEASTQP